MKPYFEVYYAEDHDLATNDTFESEEKALSRIKSQQNQYDSDVTFNIVKVIPVLKFELLFEPNFKITKLLNE